MLIKESDNYRTENNAFIYHDTEINPVELFFAYCFTHTLEELKMSTALPVVVGFSQEHVCRAWLPILKQLEREWKSKFETAVQPHTTYDALRQELSLAPLEKILVPDGINDCRLIKVLNSLKEKYAPPSHKYKYETYNAVLDQLSAVAEASFKEAETLVRFLKKMNIKRGKFNKWWKDYKLADPDRVNDRAGRDAESVKPALSDFNDPVLSSILRECATDVIQEQEAKRFQQRGEYFLQAEKIESDVQRTQSLVLDAERLIETYHAQISKARETLCTIDQQIKESEEATSLYKVEHTIREETKDNVLSVLDAVMPLDKKRKVCSSMTKLMNMQLKIKKTD